MRRGRWSCPPRTEDVLCLGAGGGQQSAVFGLLGARVTGWVPDLCRPYADRILRREDGGLEFLFNGLLDAGFTLERVHESPWTRRPTTAGPGSWDHERAFVAGEFSIVARRATEAPGG